MPGKISKYIAAFFICITCFAGVVHAQKTTDDDTTTANTDSSSVADSTSSDTVSTSALDKFSKKDTIVFSERQLPADFIRKMKADSDFWYARQKFTIAKSSQKNNSGSSSSTTSDNSSSGSAASTVFWWIILGAFIAILVFYLVDSKVWVFSKRAKRIIEPGEAVEELSDNIFTINFDHHINKAIGAGDYRLATRLLFLRLLRSMSEKNIISYAIDKTNMDYMFELGRTKYSKDFFNASRNYEYVWYGNFNVQQAQFQSIRQGLDEFNKKINN